MLRFLKGSTYTGHYEPVEEVSKILDEYERKTGIDIPIHVDGITSRFAQWHIESDH
jgi:glutamate decarboxylase